mmetsp:Transcript_8775/g.26125  ORF Transcript_8775/g.26125 Transcript_8775/m.26125 type:complete len:268 (+) Transcript_8775:321-1124(+)
MGDAAIGLCWLRRPVARLRQGVDRVPERAEELASMAEGAANDALREQCEAFATDVASIHLAARLAHELYEPACDGRAESDWVAQKVRAQEHPPPLLQATLDIGSGQIRQENVEVAELIHNQGLWEEELRRDVPRPRNHARPDGLHHPDHAVLQRVKRLSKHATGPETDPGEEAGDPDGIRRNSVPRFVAVRHVHDLRRCPAAAEVELRLHRHEEFEVGYHRSDAQQLQKHESRCGRRCGDVKATSAQLLNVLGRDRRVFASRRRVVW